MGGDHSGHDGHADHVGHDGHDGHVGNVGNVGKRLSNSKATPGTRWWMNGKKYQPNVFKLFLITENEVEILTRVERMRS